MTSAAIDAAEGLLEWQGLRTWYRVVAPGESSGAASPVVICHGGPGLTHDYLWSLTDLAERGGRTCVFYDQVGNGRSDHRPTAAPEFWNVELYVAELDALIEHLGLSGGFHLLGHSWGGMLALEYALRRPPGLRSLVLADAFSSSALYTEEVAGLVAALPEETRSVILKCEAAGSTDSAEYQQAMGVFYARHVLRTRPVPEDLQRTMAALAADPTVYTTMAGPSEFSMTGTLRDWDVTERLGLIDLPALLISGRYDEVTPRTVEQLWRGLPKAHWELFEKSSHMPHLEEHERFVSLVAEFLSRNEG